MSAWAAGICNLFASVGIILVNKQIASVCGFHFILTVLCLNFITTGTVLEIMVRLGYLEVRHLPSKDRWSIALIALLTVLLNNASNEANSVGFYQITKLLIIPTVIGIERLGGVWRTYSTGVVISLVVASTGVAIATVSDFEVNLRGSVLAFFSILVTAQYQLWQSGKQHEHGVSAMQITYSVSWPQSLLGVLAALLLDVCVPSVKEFFLLRPGGLLDFEFKNPSDPLWIVACCAIAVFMNISTYGILGKIGPVAYQVLGQLKTCLIIALGYVFFDAKAPAMWLLVRFTGVGIAVVGILSYAKFKNSEQKRKD
eukprot:TRINITY_DN1362_c0_g2_i1.p1 TRINITY_DN1362_c0_g2~~TRINITY_DN1362_c0_g2_i1.p1  ORF type:complete len:313 (-),score=70.34 TRINITY_DN1362_c0_g2_i1:62-1000(-)